MPRTFTCQNCGKVFPCNHRIKKQQKYCSSPKYQQVRRSLRKKKRYHNDPPYRKKHLIAQKAWRDAYPAHEYQKQYRSDHPEYVVRNREKQKERNKKRQKDTGSMIVNGTSLSPQTNGNGAYGLITIKKGKIVNGTSFIAQLQLLSVREAVFRQIGS